MTKYLKRMFEHLCNHLKYGFNNGSIRSSLTVFRQKTQEGRDFRLAYLYLYFKWIIQSI